MRTVVSVRPPSLAAIDGAVVLRLGLGEQRGGKHDADLAGTVLDLGKTKAGSDGLRVGLQPRHVAFREDAARVAAEAALEAGDRGVGALAECAVDEVVVVAEEDEIALDLGALVERQGAEPFAAAFVAGARADGAGERQGERDEETQSKTHRRPHGMWRILPLPDPAHNYWPDDGGESYSNSLA